MVKKKVNKMHATASKFVGSKELRSNLSGYMDQVLNKKQILLVGKKFRPEESAALINTEMLDILMGKVEFRSQVYLDEETGQYVAAIEGFNADGVGDTADVAIAMTLDNIETMVDDYFNDFSYYRRFKESLALFPHYLKLKLTGSREDLAKLLGLIRS